MVPVKQTKQKTKKVHLPPSAQPMVALHLKKVPYLLQMLTFWYFSLVVSMWNYILPVHEVFMETKNNNPNKLIKWNVVI